MSKTPENRPEFLPPEEPAPRSLKFPAPAQSIPPTPAKKNNPRRRIRAKGRDGASPIESLEARQFLSASLLSLDRVAGMPDVLTAFSDPVPLSTGSGSNPPPPHDHLIFSQQPTSAVAGQTLGPAITIEVVNAQGIPDASITDTVTLAIFKGPKNATLLGTLTESAVSGIATFTDLSLQTAGTYKLVATDSPFPRAVSSSFTISPDTANPQLGFIRTSPASVLVGSHFSTRVAMEDEFGNVISGDPIPVTLSILTGPRNSALNGTATASTVNSIATFKVLSIPLAGTYTLQAADPALPDLPAGTLSEVISQATTAVSSPHTGGTSVFGGTVTLSAGLHSPAGSAIPFTGTATLLDHANIVLGTATVSPTGHITFTLTGLNLGTYSCTIAYGGDANHTSLVSADFPLHVTAAPASTTLLPSATQLIAGQSLQLNASVASRFAPGDPPAGSVIFTDNGKEIGTGTLGLNGAASFQISNPTPGRHHYSAEYSGDGNFRISTAAARSVTVQKAATVATLDPPGDSPILAGDSITLSAMVSASGPSDGVPTGFATFFDGHKILGTVPLNPDGSATLATAFPTAGTQMITVRYSGDALNDTSLSQVALFAVS